MSLILRAVENNVLKRIFGLRRIFGPKRDEVISGGWA
jgi:hypothetical protein